MPAYRQPQQPLARAVNRYLLGRNLGPRPMELVLMGTGACSAIDVMLILRKARQSVAGCVVELDADRANDDPKVFTKIHFHFVLTGTNLAPAQVERAIKLSRDKYCSATAMMAKTATVTTDFRAPPEPRCRSAGRGPAAAVAAPQGQMNIPILIPILCSFLSPQAA